MLLTRLVPSALSINKNKFNSDNSFMQTETLCDIFSCAREKFADKCAVIYNDGEARIRKISYKQLGIESDKIAECLQELSVFGFIGVILDQDISLPAIILGILHNKLPFICIDINYTEGNIHHLLKYLSIEWIICKESCQHANTLLPVIGNMVKHFDILKEEYIVWHINSSVFEKENNNLFDVSVNFAYAIQTSGSTGTPKIIRVPHQCIVPNIIDFSKLLDIQQNDIVFWGSPLTFDPSIVELFLPCTQGASLLVTPSSIRASPPQLLDVLFPLNNLHYNGITILQTTPSSFSRWTTNDIKFRILSKDSTLKKLLFGGEPCPSMLVLSSWKDKENDTDIFNVYGITEVSCWATIQHLIIPRNLKIKENSHDLSCIEIPLGSTLSHTVVEVRNFQGEKIVDGEGELYIGSSKRFCFLNEEVMEKLTFPIFRATGDIVKLGPENAYITFVGRKNRLIKRWGHEVSLSNVEKVLGKHHDVLACYCLWNQCKSILAAAVLWKEEETSDFRIFCNTNLHKAAVPDLVVSLKDIPLTNHGKVDYSQLEVIVFRNISNQDVLSKTNKSFSELFIRAWEKVVGKNPSQEDSFNSSGGNSLLALQLSSEMERYYGEKIRNRLLTVLLKNVSFVEINEHFTSYIEDKLPECGPSTVNTVADRLTNIIDDSKVEGERQYNLNFQPLTTDASNTVHGIRKRKLSLDLLQTSKQEKLGTCEQTVILKNEICVSSNENKLISVHLRGKVIINVDSTDHFPNFSERLTLKLKWKYNMLKCIDASPCCLKFSRNCWVIVGSHSHQLAVLDCCTGDVISNCKLPDRIESSLCPSLCGRYGVVGCYDGYIYCITFIDGKIKWKFGTKDIVKSSATLCLKNTAIAIGSYDSHLYCIKLQDGILIWKASVSSGSIYTSPCVGEGLIFYGTLDGLCVAVFEKTGQVKWKINASSPIFSSPALLYSLNAVIFAEVMGIVHCFSVDTGKKLWEFRTSGNIFSSISCVYFPSDSYELLIFGCHDKNVYCLKVNKCEENAVVLWMQELDSSVFATPFVFPLHSNTVLSSSSNHTTLPMKSLYVLSASTKGTVYVCEAEAGSITTTTTLPHEVFSSPIIVGNKVFIGCRDDYLYCFTLEQSV